MTAKLHIGNMPPTSTNNAIEGLFRPFGLVSSVVFAKDPLTGLNTGCGTIEMDCDADAQSAINRLNFSQYGGRILCLSATRRMSALRVKADIGLI
ncbi:MAG: RNA-binding protein [Gammaproteobacteria bacterium]|nr:RNA-binding protein [Gammaproteobacteria bacterium]